MFNISMTTVVVTEVLMALSGLAGFYLGRRGFTGVVSDMNDIKTDLQVIKAKIRG